MKPARTILLAILAAACGKGTTTPDAGKAELAFALPAETRVVIGVDVRRVARSPLGARTVDAILRRDPEIRARLDDLLAYCGIDPAVDLETVTVAMGGPEDVAVVVKGRLDEQRVIAGARQAGATVDPTGATYAVTGKDGQKVHLAFGVGPRLVLSTSAAWLAKVADPGAPKLAGDMAARVQRVGPTAAVWGVGTLPPGVGDRLVELAKGEIAAPAAAVAFEVSLEAGVDAALSAEMATESDARKLAELARSQLDWAAIFAQRWGLGRLVAKAQVKSESNVARVSLKLDDKELAEVSAALDGKEQEK